MTADTRNRRCLVWYVIRLLREQGYQGDRCTGTDRTFDLIAWKNGLVLALCIRTARKPGIKPFQSDITRISGLVGRKLVPGIIQFWLCHPGGITKYQILAGGATLIRENAP